MENKLTSIYELLDEKKKLEDIITNAIDNFIAKTGIYPIVSIIEKEQKHTCGIYKTFEVKAIVEI